MRVLCHSLRSYQSGYLASGCSSSLQDAPQSPFAGVIVDDGKLLLRALGRIDKGVSVIILHTRHPFV